MRKHPASLILFCQIAGWRRETALFAVLPEILAEASFLFRTAVAILIAFGHAIVREAPNIDSANPPRYRKCGSFKYKPKIGSAFLPGTSMPDYLEAV